MHNNISGWVYIGMLIQSSAMLGELMATARQAHPSHLDIGFDYQDEHDKPPADSPFRFIHQAIIRGDGYGYPLTLMGDITEQQLRTELTMAGADGTTLNLPHNRRGIFNADAIRWRP
jgi:hypothetical protein